MVKIDILGAGIVGAWQAFMLQRAGHQVSVWDPAGIPSPTCASRLAGAMLGSYCEGEPGHEEARDLGLEAMELWRRHYPGLAENGTLVVAAPSGHADFQRFAAVTQGFQHIRAEAIAELEPALEGRFRDGLFYTAEGHVEPEVAMAYFIKEAEKAGALLHHEECKTSNADWIVDCRGLAARDRLSSLRGVRGERIVLECPGVTLSRPVRMLHPRIPFYIVPWSNSRFMIGTTTIESDDTGRATLRSTVEIMSAAYALIPALGEARIVDIAAGVRPSFPDNGPKALVRGRHIFVNGLYRHGFLVSPILAKMVADYIENGTTVEDVLFEDHGEW